MKILYSCVCILFFIAAYLFWLDSFPRRVDVVMHVADIGDQKQAHAILSQPFHFLTSGGQTDVYVSQDDLYVLKFFRQTPRLWVPLQKYQSKKRGKLLRDLSGYCLAAEALPKQTSLVFVHCNTQCQLDKKTVLLERYGFSRNIKINQTPFVLQNKGSSIVDTLACKGTAWVLEKIQTLIAMRSQAGIDDEDPRLQNNIGFIDDTPFFLDPGRFVLSPQPSDQLPTPFLAWIEKQEKP